MATDLGERNHRIHTQLKNWLCDISCLHGWFGIYIYIYIYTQTGKSIWPPSKNFISHPKSVIFNETN